VENKNKIEQSKAQATGTQVTGEPKPQPKTWQELGLKIVLSIWE